MARKSTASKKRTAATTPKKRRITVTLEAPEARSAVVTGTFNDWRLDQFVMKKDTNGVWKRMLTVAPGVYEYRFIVDGEWRDDPQCAERQPNEFGTQNCVLRISG